jgi:hypothetical protein
MFTWICPQCGGEVLPSQDECPRCVRAAQQQAPAQPQVPQPQAPQPQVPQYQAPPQQPPQQVVVPPSIPRALVPDFMPAQAPMPVQPSAAPAFVPQPQPVYTPPVQQVYTPPAPQAFAPPAPVAAAPAHSIYDAPPEPPRSTHLRDILVTLVVAVALMGGGFLYWTRQERAEKAASKKAELEAVKLPKSTHPFAKQIEVTGVRLRMPKSGQAEVEFLVVNHSAAEIASLTMDVALLAKGTNKEVAVFPVTVKRLSPFGFANLTAKTNTEVSAIDLPDWQFLETRISISATER